MKTEGDLAPLKAALRAIPNDFDPGGGVTTIAVRVSLIERDYGRAEQLLIASRYERLDDTGVIGPAAILDGYTFPKAWYQGLIAQGRGDLDAAERAFESAQRVVEDDLAKAPDDAKLTAMLGLVHAYRGRKDDAIAAGRRAVELLPITRDAYDGPLIAAKLAVIYAQLGEPDRAISLLSDLVKTRNGPTVGTLRVEPEWDPLRGDERFEKLAGK